MLIAAVAVVDVTAWKLWHERVPWWVTILLAVVLTLMLAAWFRVRERRERVAWSFLAVGLLLIIGALVFFEEAEAKVADGAQRQGQRPTLVVDTADNSIVAVRSAGAVGRRLDGTTLFEFVDVPKQRPSMIGFDVDVISRRRGGQLWMQRSEVRGCAERDGHIRCGLKAPTWDAADFVSLGTRASNGAITARRVAVVTPGAECTPIAGKSLRAGADLFIQTERSIEVDSIRDDEWWRSVDPDTARFVAVAGSYNSWATRKLIESCGRRCGPILTLSSAQSLRDGLAEPQWVFRLTSSNRRRVRDLVPLLEREFARVSRANTSLYVIYNDDRTTGAGDVHYAYDQAVELQDALKDNDDVPRTYWVRYRGTMFAEGDPRTNEPVPLPASSFDELVAHLAEKSRRSIVVFIDLDEKVLEFGVALARATNVARWYVPGPREIFEGAWAECLGGEAKRRSLEGARVLSPDSKNMSVAAWKFAARWAEAFGNERVPWRAARMYDALTIINDAVTALDARLPADVGAVSERGDGDELAFVHIDLYREYLREEIARATLYGASGTIAFDRHGDMLADSYVAELGPDGRLHPIAAVAPEQEAASAPERTVAGPRLSAASTPVERTR